MMTRKIKHIITTVLIIAAATACSNDEYVYPSVITEFTEICTNAKGELEHIHTDKNERYTIEHREGLDGLVPDSTYRAMTIYAHTDNPNIVSLYTAQLAIAPIPVPHTAFKEGIKTDPLDIQSIWYTHRYINMILVPMMKDKGHLFHFVDNGITLENDGTQILDITLYHDRANDYEAFKKEVYLSVPIYHYADKLHDNDKIRININTYQKGYITKEYTYKH